MKVSDRLIALLKPLFPRDATLKPVDNEGDETIVRVEWPGHRGNAVNVVVDRTTATDWEGQPGDQRAVEARVAAFVKQQLANFRPRTTSRCRRGPWPVPPSPDGSARGLL